MDQGRVEVQQAADVAADTAQGITRQRPAPLPPFEGLLPVPGGLVLHAPRLRAFLGGGRGRQLARVTVPVGRSPGGLPKDTVRPRRGGPELQEVPVQLRLGGQSGVPSSALVHAVRAVPHPVVALLQVQVPGGLARPLDQCAAVRGRAEGDLDDVLPRRIQRRRLVVHLDGEPDTAGVQPGRQPQRTGDRRAAQPRVLPRERLREARTEPVRITLDIDLPVVNVNLALDRSAHRHRPPLPRRRPAPDGPVREAYGAPLTKAAVNSLRRLDRCTQERCPLPAMPLPRGYGHRRPTDVPEASVPRAPSPVVRG